MFELGARDRHLANQHRARANAAADIARRGDTGAVYHLGDLVGYGPNPNECVARVRALPGVTSVETLLSVDATSRFVVESPRGRDVRGAALEPVQVPGKIGLVRAGAVVVGAAGVHGQAEGHGVQRFLSLQFTPDGRVLVTSDR